MVITNFSNIENEILSAISNGIKTFEELLEKTSVSDKTLSQTLEGLIAKNHIKYSSTTKEYEYQTSVNGDIVILEGNLLLPTTIIELEDKILVTRGEWYEFPKGFDIRRIVWNVKLQPKTNSNLVDLIRTSILKEKKSKIVQLEEYRSLVQKNIPYSNLIKLLIHCVGETETEVSIIFRTIIGDNDISVEHTGFTVRTLISTNELISELKKPIAERNYAENINISKLYNFSDFVFSKNEIPVSLSIDNNELTYVKITSIRKNVELSYYKYNSSGTCKNVDVEQFENLSDGIEKLKDIFLGFANQILSKNNILVELSE